MGFSVNNDLLTLQVGITAMVNISGFTSVESGIDDVILVQGEEVAITDSKLLVELLPLVSNRLTDLLANIFNDDFTHGYRLTGKESISVDLALPDLNMLGFLFGRTILHGDVHIVCLRKDATFAASLLDLLVVTGFVPRLFALLLQLRRNKLISFLLPN